MNEHRQSFWLTGLMGFLWLTTVADSVSAVALIALAIHLLANPFGMDAAFTPIAYATVAGSLVILSAGTFRRAWWLVWLEAAFLIQIPLVAVTWRLFIGSLNGSIEAGLVILVVFFPAIVLAAIHGLRLAAVWTLRRHGQWSAPPQDPGLRRPVWRAVLITVIACAGADWGRMPMASVQAARNRAAYAAKQREYAAQASQAVQGFVAAAKAGNEAELARHLATIRDVRLMATETILTELITALPTADDRTASKILECLSEEEVVGGSVQSKWTRYFYPEAPQLHVAEELMRYAIEDRRPLEPRQSAVEASCRLTNGWSGMDKRLAILEQAADPSFAVPPLCRWLRREPPPQWPTLPGRAEACAFVGRWGRSDADTVGALEFSTTFADPAVVAAAKAALEALQGK